MSDPSAKVPYTEPTTELSFSTALNRLKEGRKVKRANWGGYWELFENVSLDADGDTKATGITGFMDQIIVAHLRDNGGLAPAQPYQADLLANDWQVID